MILDNKISSTADAPTMLRRGLSGVLVVTLLSIAGIAQAQANGWSVNTEGKEVKSLKSSESAEIVSEPPSSADEPAKQTQQPVQQLVIDEKEKVKDEAAPTFVEEKKEIEVAAIAAVETLPPIKPAIQLKQSVDRNLEFKDTLDRQFRAIQELAESEDAFNEQFGELYLAYARSLLKVGRLDEARKMFANALHNAKINNGVNSLEQRPVLRELFGMSLAIGNSKDAEKHLKRLIWLDSSVPEDTYSFDMIIQLGNYYLDQFLMTPVVTEASLIGLNKAIRYYSYSIRRYAETPYHELALPYGDVAYAHYLKARVRRNIDAEVYVNARKKSHTDLDKHDTRHAIDNSFGQSNRYLRLAYARAREALDFEGTIQALIGIGDLHLLYGSHFDANTYYQLAIKSAQHLPNSHPLVESFSEPVKLPAFKLSVERDPLAYGRSYQIVPMLLDLKTNGSVGGVSRQPDVNIPMGMRIHAKNAAKNLRFRPIITEDKLVSVDDYEYDVKVRIRKLSSLANKDSEDEAVQAH